jgi:hypothetical protein
MRDVAPGSDAFRQECASLLGFIIGDLGSGGN